MFRRRGKPEPGDNGASVYHGLRTQVLDLDPATAGLGPTADRARLWGALMELSYPNGVATLVALADGTTSLYTSTGGGIIGGGAHQAVVEANRAFLASVEQYIPVLGPDPDAALPAAGLVAIRALTYTGRVAATAPEEDLGRNRHRLTPVFYAGQGVLTELRLIDESQRPN